MQSNPETILEVRRILREHLDAVSAPAQPRAGAPVTR
jgi:hypothetical protein